MQRNHYHHHAMIFCYHLIKFHIEKRLKELHPGSDFMKLCKDELQKSTSHFASFDNTSMQQSLKYQREASCNKSMLGTSRVFFEATTREINSHALNQHDSKLDITCVNQDVPSPCLIPHVELSDVSNLFIFKHCDVFPSDEKKLCYGR